MDKFKKQPYEEFVIGADFSSNFNTNTVITSQDVTSQDYNNNDATAIVIDSNTISNDGNSIVNVMIKSGVEENSPYKIIFRIVDSDNNKWELDVQMDVKEI